MDILPGAEQLPGGVQHHGQARHGPGPLHGGGAAREPNGLGSPGTNRRLQGDEFLIVSVAGHWGWSCHVWLFHGSFNQLKTEKLPPGPRLEDALGKCTAGHPAGFFFGS